MEFSFRSRENTMRNEMFITLLKNQIVSNFCSFVAFRVSQITKTLHENEQLFKTQTITTHIRTKSVTSDRYIVKCYDIKLALNSSNSL